MASLPRLLAAAALTVTLSGCADKVTPPIDMTPTPTTPTATTPATDSPSTTPPPADDLPGEAYEWPFATEGNLRVVVGRTVDDPIDLLATPDDGADTVVQLAPLDNDAQGFATGRYRKVDDAIWIELAVGGKRGWTLSQNVSQVGKAADESAKFTSMHNDPDLAELGRAVAAKYAGGSDATITVIDLRDKAPDRRVVVDVVGLEDDSIRGYRITLVPGLGEAGYTAAKVVAAPFCARGKSGTQCS